MTTGELRYHRLARTRSFRWWRPIVTVALTFGLAIAAAVLLLGGTALIIEVFSLAKPGKGVGLGTVGDTAASLAVLALLIPAVLGATWIGGGRRPGTVSSVAGRLRWRWLGLCLVVASVAVILMLAAMQAALSASGEPPGDSRSVFPGWGEFGISLAMLIVLVPLQAAGEEYLCRGLLLQAAGAFLRNPAIPIAIQALAFAAAHGWGTGWGFTALVMSGLSGGVLAVWTGGLESYIAFHTMNNLIAFGLAAGAGQLADDSTAADMPWQLALVSIAIDVLYVTVIVALARRRGLPAVTSAADPSAAGTGPFSVTHETRAPQQAIREGEAP